MLLKKIFFFAFWFGSLTATPLAEQFSQRGYVEIANLKHGGETFDSLYASFDAFIEFLQTNPVWVQKLYGAKERFIRLKERNLYSTDTFGFFDESAREDRRQISFYYSSHFHTFVCNHDKEFNQIPVVTHFLEACHEIQQAYRGLFSEAAVALGLESSLCTDEGHPPILLKLVKYLPSYVASRPHYDGSALTLFLDSTDNPSLLLSPYKSSFTVHDFSPPLRKFSRERAQNSLLLIPGTHLSEFHIYPTPHIVISSGKTRYATVAFAMRSGQIASKMEFSSLPRFGSKQ